MCHLNLDAIYGKGKLIYQPLSLCGCQCQSCLRALMHLILGCTVGRVGCILQLDERDVFGARKIAISSMKTKQKVHTPLYLLPTSTMYFTPFFIYKWYPCISQLFSSINGMPLRTGYSNMSVIEGKIAISRMKKNRNIHIWSVIQKPTTSMYFTLFLLYIFNF